MFAFVVSILPLYSSSCVSTEQRCACEACWDLQQIGGKTLLDGMPEGFRARCVAFHRAASDSSFLAVFDLTSCSSPFDLFSVVRLWSFELAGVRFPIQRLSLSSQLAELRQKDAQDDLDALEAK